MATRDASVEALRSRWQRRHQFGPALREWFGWKLRGKETALADPGSAAYLDFVPAVRSAEELADLSARVNWYLPASARQVAIYVEGRDGLTAPTPDLAAHMEPSLVTDPGWSSVRPSGKRHIVVHRVTPKTTTQYLAHPRSATMADVAFAYTGEEALFSLHRELCGTELPGAAESIERLMTKASPGGSAFVLATGPSAKLVDPDQVQNEVRITCNSAVRDHDLLARLKPDVIAFSDPVFHTGPSRYASAFRADLLRAIEDTDAVFVTTQLYSAPLVAHMPEIRDRLVVLTIEHETDWHWPTAERPTARHTGNVLTNLMLPVAFALTDRVDIAGCDGRDPSETYFWTHNAKTQYSDALMQAAFDAHPAFFRKADYADYYDTHCAQLEEFLNTAESRGKSAHGVTPSFIPALRERGAPLPARPPAQASSDV